jgi:hypothetical protein
LKPIYLSTAEPIHISQFFFKKIHTSSFFRLMNYAAVSGPTAAASPLHVGSTHPPATAVSGEPWQVLYKLAESRADRGGANEWSTARASPGTARDLCVRRPPCHMFASVFALLGPPAVFLTTPAGFSRPDHVPQFDS